VALYNGDMDLQHWRTWKKRNPDFPLSVCCNGQWGKKIKGHRYYFGPLADPEAAHRLYMQERDYLAAGVDPPGWMADNEVTLGDILERHLASVQQRVELGERSRHTLEDYKTASRAVEGHPLTTLRADAIKPTDWESLRLHLAGKGWSLRTLRGVIMSIRGVMRWAEKMELCSSPRFGAGFDPPTPKQVERRAKQKDRYFTPEQVNSILEAAGPRMKAATLLALNCGFTANDLAQITRTHVHLDEIPFHDFPRPKTGQARSMVLIPDTVLALKELPESGHLFPNRSGKPFQGQAINSALIREFNRLPGVPAGISIGSLRHTFATIIGQSRDEEAKALAMGHTQKSLQARVYSQQMLSELSRLQELAELVRRWLC